MKNTATTAPITDLLRVYYAETSNNTPARVAYNRAEAWHYSTYGCKKYRNYETFKTTKHRHLKRIRQQKPQKSPKTPRQTPHYQLYMQVIETYIATPQLREEWIQKWEAL